VTEASKTDGVLSFRGMRAPRLIVRALGVAGLVNVVVCGVAPIARAQEAEALTEGIDDPKVERRLGSRIELRGAPALDASLPSAYDAGASPALDARPAGSLEAGPAGPAAPAPRVPHLKIAYRWLTLAQVGPAPAEGKGGDQTFHVISLDFYPISSNWRLGLSTQYGWESGTFRKDGDAFLAQSLSLGGQIPGPVFTPFFEAHAGGGLMQRMHEELSLTSKATAYGQFGLDAGTEVFLAHYAYLSFAIGWVHAINVWVRKDELGSLGAQSFALDSFSIKVGYGL
jgi:hypothetical protein